MSLWVIRARAERATIPVTSAMPPKAEVNSSPAVFAMRPLRSAMEAIEDRSVPP
jgi:hypothetical protein